MEFIMMICISALIVYLYVQRKKNSNFWNIRGVKGPPPENFLMWMYKVTQKSVFHGDRLKNIMEEFKAEKMIGIFNKTTPVLLIRDPNFIKDVLITDFSTFSERGRKMYEKGEPLAQHLLHLELTRWKPIRKGLSAAFTRNSVEKMFPLFVQCSERFKKYLNKLAMKNMPAVECRSTAAIFTADVIGSYAFGVDFKLYSDENNELLERGKKVIENDFSMAAKKKLREFSPWLFNCLGSLTSDKMYHLINIFLIDVMDFRRRNKSTRNDFVDLLRHIKDNPNMFKEIEITESLINSQAFVVFTAGFESAATTMGNALYELAQNTKIQNKLRGEIQEALDNKGGQLDFESVGNMQYLDKVLQETLRKYAPTTTITRKATKEYTFRGTNITVPKGQKIEIPVYAIHRDPLNYPDPNTFDPERFSLEQISLRHRMLFMPFGHGPRYCLAKQFAIYQTKMGLITMINTYKYTTCKETKQYENNPNTFLVIPKNGIWLKMTPVS